MMEDGERERERGDSGKSNHAGVDGAHGPSTFISAAPEHIKLSLNEKHTSDCQRKTSDSN